MKKIVSFAMVGLLLAAGVSHAAYISASSTTNAAIVLTTNDVSVGAATIITGTGAATIKFYDADTNDSWVVYTSTDTVSNILSAYVTRTSSAQSYASNYISTMGVTNYYTNVVLSTTYTTNAASTNEMPVALQLLIPASTTVNYTDLGINAANGLIVHQDTNVTYLLSTTPLR